MTSTWDARLTGVLRLPSGRRIRGRGLRQPAPDAPCPTFGLYLLAKPPPRMEWDTRWLRWPDFWLPTNHTDAREALMEAWHRAAVEQVEIACSGGRGRTGTALACIAVLDGLPPGEAVAFIRNRYNPRAVETPWQRRYVHRFSTALRCDV